MISPPPILAPLFGLQTDIVRALADVWLSSGAKSVSIWANDELLACWPGDPLITPTSPGGISAPLFANGKLVGILLVDCATGFEAEARLHAEADMLSHLIRLEDDLEQLTDELVDTQDQLLALYDLTQSARTRVSLDETLASLAAEATRMVKSGSAFIVLAEPNHPNMVVQYPPNLYTNNDLIVLFQRLCGQKIALNLTNISAPVSLPDGMENSYVTPVLVGNKSIAALGLINKRGGFASPDIKLVCTIAEQAGVQIENMLLYRETLAQAKMQGEIELAARIQLGLLPKKTPKVAGIDVCGRARPALRTGGDLFDFISETGRPFVFAVGDVSGKGVSAALGMAMTHSIFQSAARFMPLPNPQKLLHRLNEDLYDDLTEVGLFVTMFAGQYMPDNEEILYANAGHSPVIYCPAGGHALMLEADGTAVGVLPISMSETQTLHFGPGDLLLVATDGFCEASNSAGEMFGYDALLRM